MNSLPPSFAREVQRILHWAASRRAAISAIRPQSSAIGGPAAHFSTLASRPSTAFTLIELLIVISIIAILAALALPAVGGAIKTARKAEVRSMANQIKLAVASYYAEYGIYPAITNTGPEFLQAMSGATNVSTIPNRRGIRFIEVPSKYSNASGIVTPQGLYKNKTEQRVFNIHSDTNYDGRLEFNPGTGQTNMSGSVAVWVADPDQTNKAIGTW